MKKETSVDCGRATVSVMSTDAGFICYNCYAEKKTPSRKKVKHEEADIQTEFFAQGKTRVPKAT